MLDNNRNVISNLYVSLSNRYVCENWFFWICPLVVRWNVWQIFLCWTALNSYPKFCRFVFWISSIQHLIILIPVLQILSSQSDPQRLRNSFYFHVYFYESWINFGSFSWADLGSKIFKWLKWKFPDLSVNIHSRNMLIYMFMFICISVLLVVCCNNVLVITKCISFVYLAKDK